MAKEIERKFLIKRELWQPKGDGVSIRQGYLSLEPERTVRVRLKGERGFLTIKGKNHGISRMEMEYEIPAKEAAQLLDDIIHSAHGGSLTLPALRGAEPRSD